MIPVAILDMIRTPAAKILGVIAMIAAIFIAGCIHGEGSVTAKWNDEKVTVATAVAEQAVSVANLTNKSQSINSEVSNYVQARSSDLSARLGGVRDDKSSHGTLSGVSGGTTGTATGGTGCISAEQYNDIAWEAGNTAVMVIGWQLWYEKQREAWQSWQRDQQAFHRNAGGD
jgi:hypothetical protein